MKWIEAATFQCLLFKFHFCRVQGFPGRAIGAAAGEKREQRYCALGLPLPYWSSCIFICFINWTPLWLHLNKNILLLKKWLKTVGFDHVYLWYHIHFSTPNHSAFLERGLHIYLFNFWLFMYQQRMELSLPCFGFFSKTCPILFWLLSSFCSLLLMFSLKIAILLLA